MTYDQSQEKTVETNTETNRNERENEEVQKSKDAFESPRSDKQSFVLTHGSHAPGDKCLISALALYVGDVNSSFCSAQRGGKQLSKPKIPKPHQELALIS